MNLEVFPLQSLPIVYKLYKRNLCPGFKVRSTIEGTTFIKQHWTGLTVRTSS